MYDSSINLKNVGAVGYIFSIEEVSETVNQNLRGKLNNYNLPTSKFMSMSKMTKGI